MRNSTRRSAHVTIMNCTTVAASHAIAYAYTLFSPWKRGLSATSRTRMTRFQIAGAIAGIENSS